MESIKNSIIIFQSLLLLLLMIGIAAGQALPKNIQFHTKPEHIVLIIIDGLSFETWDRLELPVLENMIATGAVVDQLYLPPPAHPHEGPYAILHTCSTPNPILMSGTLFIDENTTS